MNQHLQFLMGIVVLLCLSNCEGAHSAPRQNTNPPAPDPSTTITVATAANVQFAMKELIEIFEKDRKVEVKSVISSSGKLTAQIMEGAPYDVFVSADMKYPKTLLKQGAAQGEVKVYAYGILVAWSLNPLRLTETPEYLLAGQIHKIAIANPRIAPYGKQSLNYLNTYGVYEQVKPKLVYGESIAQTNQYIMTKAVDVGLTAKSVVLSPGLKGKGYWVELPDSSYNPIQQGVVITKNGQEHHPEQSLNFYTFLFSEEARQIFRKYGYKLPPVEKMQ